MNTDNWDWPQWVMLFLLLLTLVATICLHDRPRPNVNGFFGFVNFSITMWLLIAGGFFK